MSSSYDSFVRSKLGRTQPTGIDVPACLKFDGLFDFQSDLAKWALRRGRAALFAATGLGKTRMQLTWAEAVRIKTGRPVLILAPLAVAAQTVEEGKAIGIYVHLCRDYNEMRPSCVNITNYDRLHRFENAARELGGLVLDESSIIKHHDARTLQSLLEFSESIAFKLAATATPAPNDFTELGTHAEFLGICKRQEMLAEYFVHDGGATHDWRLKGHARRDFWRFVSSWGALVRKPSDLGYEDDGYALPPLRVHQHTTAADLATARKAGLLFPMEASDLMERRAARRASIDDRVMECAKLVNGNDRPWVVWCDLNAESEALARELRGAIEVRGSMDADDKEPALVGFAHGQHRVIVTKPSIAGFGLNWQHCHDVAFVGVTDSWEQYYQSVRRCWRFGQRNPVDVHVFASEAEGSVIRNLERKERDALTMAESLAAETRDMVRVEVRGQSRVSLDYNPTTTMAVPQWLTGWENS